MFLCKHQCCCSCMVIIFADWVGHSDCSVLQIGLVEPAVTGTLKVLKACSKEGLKRVVVSSLFAVWMNQNWPCDRVTGEGCWSDMEYCKASEVILLN